MIIRDRPLTYFEYIPSKIFRLVLRVAEKRAYNLDPEYKRIEDLRNQGGPKGTITMFNGQLGLGMDEWLYQRKVRRELTPPLEWAHKLLILSMRPEIRWSQAKAMWRRAKTGYDLWALNDFRSWHADIVHRVLSDMSFITHPSNRTIDEWEFQVSEVAKLFKELRNDPTQARVDAALAALATIYLDLWI
jgi:uncharacterized protein YdhG (YjbR/CyaY superfamily)